MILTFPNSFPIPVPPDSLSRIPFPFVSSRISAASLNLLESETSLRALLSVCRSVGWSVCHNFTSHAPIGALVLCLVYYSKSLSFIETTVILCGYLSADSKYTKGVVNLSSNIQRFPK